MQPVPPPEHTTSALKVPVSLSCSLISVSWQQRTIKRANVRERQTDTEQERDDVFFLSRHRSPWICPSVCVVLLLSVTIVLFFSCFVNACGSIFVFLVYFFYLHLSLPTFLCFCTAPDTLVSSCEGWTGTVRVTFLVVTEQIILVCYLLFFSQKQRRRPVTGIRRVTFCLLIIQINKRKRTARDD